MPVHYFDRLFIISPDNHFPRSDTNFVGQAMLMKVILQRSCSGGLFLDVRTLFVARTKSSKLLYFSEDVLGITQCAEGPACSLPWSKSSVVGDYKRHRPLMRHFLNFSATCSPLYVGETLCLTDFILFSR